MMKYPVKYIDILINDNISIEEFNDAMSNHADQIYGRRISKGKMASYLEHLRDERRELVDNSRQPLPQKVVDYNNLRIAEIDKDIVKYDGITPLSFDEAFPDEKNNHN